MSCVREISEVYQPLSYKHPPLQRCAINKLFDSLIVASNAVENKVYTFYIKLHREIHGNKIQVLNNL